MASEGMPFDLAPGRCAPAADSSFDIPEQKRRSANLSRIAKTNRRIALYPIIFFQIYLAVSVLVFAFGPWPWPISNPWQLYTFLLLAQGALFAGYRSAVRAQPRPASTRLSVPAMVAVSLASNFLFIGETYKTRTAQTTFGVDEAVTAVNAGLRDPGQQYDAKQNNAENQGGESTIIGYLYLLMYPVMWIAFPLGIVFWKRLPVFLRAALVGWIVVDLSMWVATGTNKGIADYVLLLPSLLVARNPNMLVNIRLRNVIMMVIIAMTGAAALFTFFSLGMLGRSNGNVPQMYDNAAGLAADPDNLALRYLPPELQGSVASFTSYFIQGYYAVSLSLEKPFVFCYGVGNSYFLEGLSKHLVSTPIGDDTYPARIEGTGWDSHRNWHSIYPWIASDLSFPGTLLFMFVVGRLLALVWLDVVFCRNIWAVCLLPLVLTMLFYVPANNQVLGYAQGAMPFWALLCVWLYSRRGGRRTARRLAPV